MLRNIPFKSIEKLAITQNAENNNNNTSNKPPSWKSNQGNRKTVLLALSNIIETLKIKLIIKPVLIRYPRLITCPWSW